MCAVASGRFENVKLLLEANADVNAADENGETVIHKTKRIIIFYLFNRKYRYTKVDHYKSERY